MPTFECPSCKKTFSVCRKEDARYRPFCSERCKMVDLGRWLDGTYKITEPASPEGLNESSSDEEESQ